MSFPLTRHAVCVSVYAQMPSLCLHVQTHARSILPELIIYSLPTNQTSHTQPAYTIHHHTTGKEIIQRLEEAA